MNDKSKNNSIILPEEDGVSNLEIKRIAQELAQEKKPVMHGYMPEKIVEPTIRELKKVIKSIEDGQTSALCVISIEPDGIACQGIAFITAPNNEMEHLHELFHMIFNEQKEPDGEAG